MIEVDDKTKFVIDAFSFDEWQQMADADLKSGKPDGVCRESSRKILSPVTARPSQHAGGRRSTHRGYGAAGPD